jgi:hypothetical protein
MWISNEKHYSHGYSYEKIGGKKSSGKRETNRSMLNVEDQMIKEVV